METNYIFLKKEYSEGPESFYAIDAEKIETMNLSDTYDQFGQLISNSGAGDSLILETEEAAKRANELSDDGEYSVGDYISAYESGELFDELLGTDGVELVSEQVKGFNYWDGHNWKTVIVSAEVSPANYAIVNDADLVKDLNNAIEEKEFERSEFGKEIYTSGEWVVIDDHCQGSWASFEVVSALEYEMN